jgi:hypothetical protein
MGAAMNELAKLMGCRERISPMRPLSPMGPIRLFELNQKPGAHLWTSSINLVGGAVTQINAALTDINARLTDYNGLCNAQKPNV